ncbi:MAG: AGE family epimerase/isomerase, partial [Thaumarchaeota archaeon]|nr:AGE family epimerase/isomerase [Nitrososphaerota archaeon]
MILIAPAATATGLVPGVAGSDAAAAPAAVTASIPFLNLSMALANRLHTSLLNQSSGAYYNAVSSDWTTVTSAQYSTLGNAFIVAGLLQLYQATENQTYLAWASTTSNQFWNHAWAPEAGGFYDMYYPSWVKSTCDQIAQDNAMFEIDFLSLYHLNGSSQWLQRAGTVEQLLNNRFWNTTDNIVEIGYDPCTGIQSGDVSIEISIGSYLWATGLWTGASGDASYVTRMNAAASFAHRYLWDSASNTLRAGPGSTDCGGPGGSMGFMRTVYANLTGLEDCRKGANEDAWGAVGLAELYSLTGNSTLLSWTDQDLSWINSTLWDPVVGGYHNDEFRDDTLRSSCSSTNDPDDYPGWTQGEQPMLWWKIGELTSNATLTHWSLVAEKWTAEHQWNYTHASGGDMTCLNSDGLPDTGSPDLYDWVQGSALYSFSTITSTQAATKPAFSDVSMTGVMKAGTPVTFNTRWTDAIGLSSYVPGYDSGSGALVNGSSVRFSGTTSWANFTETLPSSVGTKIQWQVYATDTSSLSNKTDTACSVTGFSGNVAASSHATVVDDCYDLLVYDGTHLYNLGTLPQLVHTTSTSTGYHVIAWNPAFSSALLVGYGDALVRYDSGMFTILNTGLASSISLNGVAWRPNNNTFALIAGDGGKLLSYSNGVITLLASSTTQMLQKIAWSPDGKYALIVGNAGTILKYTAKTGAITSIPSGVPGNNLQGVAFAPDGTIALMVGTAGRVLEYAGASGTVSSPLAGVGSSYQFQDVEFSLDGAYALLTSQNNVRGDLVRWTTLGGTFDNITSGVSSTANQIAFAPNDSYAYVTTTAGILLKETYNSNTATQIPLTDNRLRGIAFYAPGSPLALDGSVSGGVNLATTVSVSLTTSCSPDVIIVLIGENTARAIAKVGTPTSPGLTFTPRASLQSGTMQTWEYYSIATSPLTSQAITEVMSQQTAYTMTAFGVCGANTAAPFDTNPGLPKVTGGFSGTSHPNTVTTSNVNDFIFDLDASRGNPSYTPLNGYASVLTQQVPSWMASSTEYKVVFSTQSGSSLGFALSIGESGSQIVDAIVAGSRASAVTQPITLTINEAGGPAATFTVHGCGATPSTIPGDGASHLVTM